VSEEDASDHHKCVHVYVEGRVQGVWFRGWTEDTATGLGLSGWVRNLRDGRVEAVFQGLDEAVDRMTALCHVGPPHARVTSVEVEAVKLRDVDGFTTLPTA
jgi:acylphosphatase